MATTIFLVVLQVWWLRMHCCSISFFIYLELRALITLVTTIWTPDTGIRISKTRLTTCLASTYCTAVPFILQTFHQTCLFPRLRAPRVTRASFLTPNAFDPMFTWNTRFPVVNVSTLTRNEPDHVVLGLSIETSVKVDAVIEVDCCVTKPN